ncbi:hypothetical protein B9Z19DRAFT_1196717 [Tuber borchii]|uniref:Uncharacterized protein n=1 Tax=Tuber borchii TaxID=42251 RepID=A0A2T6ZE27_TUBBO|nr:hypothetical protein B9Z19DRAFT_1196717 [Tuber borchii]
MVIKTNFLAVALGGIFDQKGDWKARGGVLVETFPKDLEERWLVVNTNVVEGTDLLAWATDEFYFLPFKWEPGKKAGLRTSITQGYGGSLTCRLLAGDAFRRVMDGGLGYWPSFGINIMMPISDGDSVRCGNNQTMDFRLKEGTHPFPVEWVWASKPQMEVTKKPQQISTGEFRVTVDGEGRVKRSKLSGELKYDDPGIFNLLTSVGNFTAQSAMLLRIPPPQRLDVGIMHNDNQSHSFSQFIGEYLINKTLSDLSTPSPNFEDAQHALSKFYKRFSPIVLTLNQGTIFAPTGSTCRSEVGQLESVQPRMSMGPLIFYIAVAILGFQLITGTIILWSGRPRRFLPRFPYNLAFEISLFHASRALSDVARTANMNSAMHSRHLKRLGAL